jgi:glutamyl-Q tRNA(Asp) synthetase
MPLTVTRFAPSPTGPLHRGHALAALVAHDLARRDGGRFLLRIEDIDTSRCRPEYVAGIEADLQWLGLAWDGPALHQSTRLAAYGTALESLVARGLAYPCFCTRREIAAEVARMGAAPHGPEGPLYPGTCRQLTPADRSRRLAAGIVPALRLDVAACCATLATTLPATQITTRITPQPTTLAAGPLAFTEGGHGPAGERGVVAVQPDLLGDVVLGRRDVGVAYHLACVLDDAFQGVTLVTRGEDLFAATHVQRLLQAVLGLPAPGYHHHVLVRDADGRRLAKRDAAEALATLRAAGVAPADLRAQLRGLAGP